MSALLSCCVLLLLLPVPLLLLLLLLLLLPQLPAAALPEMLLPLLQLSPAAVLHKPGDDGLVWLLQPE